MHFLMNQSRPRILTLATLLVGTTLAVTNAANETALVPQLADALRRADVDAARCILEVDPAQLNARDKRGWTPLMHAAFYADAECVRLLLQRDADVNASNQAGATALHYAATDLEKTRLLLKAGADANAASHLGNTSLMLAARSSRSSPIVRLLLGNRADVHTRNAYGVTALMLAASSDDVETVKLLLDRGSDPSLAPYHVPLDDEGKPLDPVFGGGFKPLSWASLKGNFEIAKLLLDAGADVNGQSPFGSPLACAAQRNRAQIARLLLERGAEVNAIDAPGGWSPLMWAAGNENGDTDVLKLLIEHGANVNAAHGESWGPQMSVPHSPLMVAKRRGETSIVELLREAGAEEQIDPWSVKVRTPPRRDVSAKNVDTKRLLAAVTAAVPLLERTAVESVQEFTKHGFNCVSCHNQLLPLMAVSLAKQKGAPHNEEAVEQMLLLQADEMPEFHKTIKSEVTFEPAPSSFFGYFLWGLASESIEASFATDVAVHCVAVYQAEDGSWLQPFPRPPITDSEISATALGVRALTLYPLLGRKAEMDERVARARKWLRTATARNTEDYTYKLLGLYWAREAADDLRSLAKELADLQRSDGGWAQLPKLESDAYATGQALYALHEAGGLTLADDVLKNGLAYLLRTQMEDGSWFVRRRAYPFQPTMDPKFPHGRDAWISTAATCWAVMALSVSLDKEEVANNQEHGHFVASKITERTAPELPRAYERQVDFDKDILPILEYSCLTCHSSSDKAGEYALDTRESLIKGGFSGPPVVIPGNSADSLLIHHVAGLIEDVEMPPLARRNEFEALSDEQIGLLRAWIDQGLPGLAE